MGNLWSSLVLIRNPGKCFGEGEFVDWGNPNEGTLGKSFRDEIYGSLEN